MYRFSIILILLCNTSGHEHKNLLRDWVDNPKDPTVTILNKKETRIDQVILYMCMFRKEGNFWFDPDVCRKDYIHQLHHEVRNFNPTYAPITLELIRKISTPCQIYKEYKDHPLSLNANRNCKFIWKYLKAAVYAVHGQPNPPVPEFTWQEYFETFTLQFPDSFNAESYKGNSFLPSGRHHHDSPTPHPDLLHLLELL